MHSHKIRCLIIDDDPFIRDLLQDKLNQYVPEVVVLATADSGTEGIEHIKSHQPELIFLDVEMADMTGFEMLANLDSINFQTIFITSYSHYAIKAIRFNALDYLIKPIDLGELKRAIRRYKDRIKQVPKHKNLTLALRNMATKRASAQVLTLQTQEGELQLTLKDIIRIEGERNYSYIYLIHDKKKLVTKTLADLEDLMNDKGFFRCHKSHIINEIHIIASPNQYTITLSDTTEVPVSRRKKDSFKSWYETIQNEKV